MGIDLSKLTDKIQEMVGEGEVTAVSQEALTANLKEVQKIVDSVHDALSDGLQWDDLATLGKIVCQLVAIAESLEGKTGEEKAKFVEDAVWVVYKYYDPNIPYVPEFIERRIEPILVRNGARIGLEAVLTTIQFMKDKFTNEPVPADPEKVIANSADPYANTKVDESPPHDQNDNVKTDED